MRFAIKLIVVLAILWSGWWALASYGMSRGITAWVDARTAEGWHAEVQASQGGFPFNISTKVAELDVTNPLTSTSVQASGITLNARTYWPGNVDIDLPDTPITLGGSAGQTTLTAQDATLAVRLRAGLALEMRRLHLNSAAWTMQSNDTEILNGAGLTVTADQTAVGSARYDVSLNADALAFGAFPRQILAIPAALPETFETFTATGAVTFDAPLTRATTPENPPQFRQIILDGVRITWGSIALRAMGALDVDEAGIPSGTIEIQAKDWRNLLDLAQTAGVLPPERRGQAELIFTLLAGRGGQPEDLDLTLSFENDRMLISGIPLGPAPRLVFQ